jgi:integrase
LSIKPRGDGYEVRWLEAGRRHSKQFVRKGDAEVWDLDRRRRKQLGQAAVVEDVVLNEFIATYWRLHAMPNLTERTRQQYKELWARYVRPRLGGYGVREVNSVKRLARFRDELVKAGVPAPTVIKAMTLVQSILTFAVSEEIIDYSAGRAVPKPEYQRKRAPHIFLPADVESIRGKLDSLRDRTLVSVLAYAGPRPEEALRLDWQDVGRKAIRFTDTKRGGRHRERWTPLLKPLAEDLREWFMASGRPASGPVFPAHDGAHWHVDDWRNWRKRVWCGKSGSTKKPTHRGQPQNAPRPGCAPKGTRPRDLRSSYVTVQVYAGVPLTTIAKEIGTSVAMLERHYAGVIANWDGHQISAAEQIYAARRQRDGRKTDASRITRTAQHQDPPGFLAL